MLSGAPASEKTSVFSRHSTGAKTASDWSIYSRDFTRVHLDTSSDTRLEWLGDGSLFELDSNKRQEAKMVPLFESPPRLLLKSGLQPLYR